MATRWMGISGLRFRLLLRISWAIILALPGGWFQWEPALAYPSAGVDEFDSAATVVIDLAVSGGPILKATLVGPTRVQRGAPYDPGDGRLVIDTEIVALELHGLSPVGPLIIRESPARASTGAVQQQSPGVDFPADSFFDVFVEIETPLGQLHNNDPIRLQAEINSLPPWQVEYTPPAITGVSIFDRSGHRVGVITHASHFVGQKPTFSLAAGGPSGYNPATLFDLPTAPRLLPADLGLGSGDNLDALSYGTDYINYNSDLRFSVDALAVGLSGSAVSVEAGKTPNQAHGDEFGVTPPLPFGGSNVQILDESGDTAPPFPLLVSDDIDALTEPPTDFVDPDGDGIPDFPVYFSLDPGSPTLADISAGPADILQSVGGAAPSVFVAAGNLGLVAGDDLDAICLDLNTLSVLYSLAPGSPTLGLTGAGPADLFLVVNPTTPIPPPGIFVSAALLGLAPTDNLNALKCSLPEVDYFGYTLADIVIESPTITNTVRLSGPTLVKVAISPDGAAVDSDKDGLDQVQTEMVSLDLRGDSTLGPVLVRLRSAQEAPFHGSYGEIEERKNSHKGRLDLPPYTSSGKADSFFDIFFEVEIGGQVFHNLQPKRLTGLITHKPPRVFELYTSQDKVELYNQNNQPTGIFISGGTHTPHLPIILSDFTRARATLALQTSKGVVSVQLSGLASQVLFTNPSGRAEDLDGNGLDQVQTEMIQLNLTGNSSLGPVTLRLRDPAKSPHLFSVGEVEEAQNKYAGRLDLPPFSASGKGSSTFEMFFEVEIGGQVFQIAEASQILHNELPLSLQAEVGSATPGTGVVFTSQGSVELFDDSSSSSGYSIPSLRLVPDPLPPGRVNYLPVISGKPASRLGFVPASRDRFDRGQWWLSTGGATTLALSLAALFILGRRPRF